MRRGTSLARSGGVNRSPEWEAERRALLGQRISDLELRIGGSRVERLVAQLYAELAAHGVSFRPPVYLSDQWGCPDGTPLIGVPFYLADARLERLESEMSGGVEDDAESMRYMRHECGHAVNYAFRLHDRRDWQRLFGRMSRPYRDRYGADPFSRAYVRHILGWYAQKHPDEDFAETFAVWLTPGFDWRESYAGWPALEKLEYVDRVMREIGPLEVAVPTPTEEDLPVEAMRYTVAAHYAADDQTGPMPDRRQFDVDLRRIFAGADEAPAAERACYFVRRHLHELLGRIAYWTAEPPWVVRRLLEQLAERSEELDLRAHALEATTLIELTAFGTAVVMNYRYAHVLESTAARTGGERRPA